MPVSIAQPILQVLLTVFCSWFISGVGTGQVCTFTEIQATIQLGLNGEEVSWSILDIDSNLVAGPFDGYTTNTFQSDWLCLETGCYWALLEDSYGDGWQGAQLQLTYQWDGVEESIGFQMESASFSIMTPFSIGTVCGCTDESASNYYAEAETEDGSCFDCDGQAVWFELFTGTWASELSWTLFNENEEVALVGTDLFGMMPWLDFTTYGGWACLEPDCYTLYLADSYGDGWQGGEITVSVMDSGQWVFINDGTVPEGEFSNTIPIPLSENCPIPGCTLEGAINFDPGANVDDGSCSRQSDNVNVFGQWSDSSLPINGLEGSYNDVEGISVNGREFAIIGSTTGTHIIDITEMEALSEVTHLPGAYSGNVTHRDYHLDGNILYAVCDQGASTLQIFDLAELPNAVTTLYDSDALIRTAHNVFVDNDNDLLYACSMQRTGLSTPVLILDVSDPSAPLEVMDLSNIVSSCHDIYVENNLAWVNAGGTGTLVVEITPTPSLVGIIDEYPFQGGNHSGWWVVEDQIYVFADETHGSPLKVVDTSDLSDMNVLSTLSSGTAPNAIPHNLMIRDDLVFVSYYHDGLQVFDISDPSTPSVVAYFDTYAPDHHNGYAGAWGVHAALPSGKVLISDVQSGLFVLELTPELLPICTYQALSWNGIAITEPGYYVEEVANELWGTDIAFAIAHWDDENCSTCNGDLDGSGSVGSGDLLLFLSNWGCQCNVSCALDVFGIDCPADLNGDSVVNLPDLLILLAIWGTPCS